MKACIRAMFAEDDICVDLGWTGIQTYFVIGLPDDVEVDEPVLFADLNEQVCRDFIAMEGHTEVDYTDAYTYTERQGWRRVANPTPATVRVKRWDYDNGPDVRVRELREGDVFAEDGDDEFRIAQIVHDTDTRVFSNGKNETRSLDADSVVVLLAREVPR